MEFSSAAAVAAAVVQSEGYKPREERGWEEFHPNLDIEATFLILHSEDVDGTRKSTPPPPPAAPQNALDGAGTPSKDASAAVASAAGEPSTQPEGAAAATPATAVETPTRRRTTRPRDAVSFYATRSDLGATPKTPKVLSTLNQTPKERLDLKNPSYRKTDRILLFESKTFGQAKYVEKAMMNVGYQESDNFIRPERQLLKASDAHVDEDVDQLLGQKAEGEVVVSHSGSNLGRVEYDMDEQDDMWLETLNAQRKVHELEPVTREIFEITVTKIEKEWHALEKKIPKPNPKPPQTHRPRSSSAAAVNGETQAGEEQDSKCAICDDGDCENTNAIVFCDGCDLAVHQECYGVPFIPEGQWMCRKCQLAGRGIPVSESHTLPAGCITCASAQKHQLTLIHRPAFFARIPMGRSNRPTTLNGPTCSVRCGSLRFPWATIHSWSLSWMWIRSPRTDGSFSVTYATRRWGPAYSVVTRHVTRPFMSRARGEPIST